MMAHKAWVDNLRTSNFQAAKAWLEVKDKETFGPKEDSQARVIIEFATGPSPFIDPNARPNAQVTVPIKEPLRQTKDFEVKKSKKKSVSGSKVFEKGGEKAKTTSSTKKPPDSKTKPGGEGKTESKSK